MAKVSGIPLFFFFACLMPLFLNAEDRRVIPLDVFLIIDDSEAFQSPKKDTMTWINEQVVDRVLMDGDRITIWAAADRVRLVHSDTLSGAAGKESIKAALGSLDSAGRTADFTGALRQAASRSALVPRSRLAYTILVTASAEGLEPILATSGASSDQDLLKWSRSEKYEGWQVYVVAFDIGERVRQALSAYSGSLGGGAK